MSWYYAENGTQKGPVNDVEFQSLVQAGTVREDTLVWREGMANWASYAQARAGSPAAGTLTATAVALAPDSGQCAECGGVFSRNDMVAYGDKLVCAGCRDAFFQKVREGVTTGAAMNFGGFWIRFLAKIIDMLALMAVNMVIQIPYMALVFPLALRSQQEGPAAAMGFFLLNFLLIALQLGISFGYSTFFVGRYGATPGKMALSLKVVRADGSKVTYLRAFGRAVAEILSAIILYIGYIMAGFDEEKRSLHDRICDTRVIKTN